MNALLARVERFLAGIGEGTGLFLQSLYWCKAAPRNVDKILAHLLEFGNATLPIASLMAIDRKSTRLNSSHYQPSRMPSSA